MRWLLGVALLCACDGAGSTPGDPDARSATDGAPDPGSDGGMVVPRMVEVTLANRPTNTAAFSFLVAYQDGSAPWRLAPAPSGDVYRFPVSAPSWGVAYTCVANLSGSAASQLRAVTSAHFAVGERTSLTLSVPAQCSDRTVQTVGFTGSVMNRSFGGVTVVAWGSRATTVAGGGTFSMQVPPGTADLIVVHAVGLGNNEYYVDEALVTRNLTISAATSRTIDFGPAQNTRFFNVNFNTFERATVATTLYTANGTVVGLNRDSSNNETVALASNQTLGTDIYDRSITMTRPGSSATRTSATSTPGGLNWVEPAALGAISTTVPTKTPYVTLETTWNAYTGVAGYQWNAVQQPSATQCGNNVPCTIAWTALLSPGVTGALPAYRMPDLAGLVGFSPALALLSGVQTFGGVTAQTSTAGGGDFPPATPATGTQRVFVRSDYTVTP